MTETTKTKANRAAKKTAPKQPATKAAKGKRAKALAATAATVSKLTEKAPAGAKQAVSTIVAAVKQAPKALASEPKAAAFAAPVSTLLSAGTDQAREAYARAQATTQSLRQAVTESATATTRGAVEINGKVIDAVRAQSDAALDLWRAALTAGSVSEAIRIQTGGARQVYETAATQWKDIAEASARLLTASVKPMQSVWTDQGR